MALRAENAELKRRPGLDSRNSSKPPSTDSPFAKPAPKSLRGKSGRKPGGQPGHLGSTLAQAADPNQRSRHEPARGAGCGSDLADGPEVGMEKRQGLICRRRGGGDRASAHRAPLRVWGDHRGTALQGVSALVEDRPWRTAIVLYRTWSSSCRRNVPPKRWPSCSAPRVGGHCRRDVRALRRRLDGFLDALRERIVESISAGSTRPGRE